MITRQTVKLSQQRTQILSDLTQAHTLYYQAETAAQPEFMELAKELMEEQKAHLIDVSRMLADQEADARHHDAMERAVIKWKRIAKARGREVHELKKDNALCLSEMQSMADRIPPMTMAQKHQAVSMLPPLTSAVSDTPSTGEKISERIDKARALIISSAAANYGAEVTEEGLNFRPDANAQSAVLGMANELLLEAGGLAEVVA